MKSFLPITLAAAAALPLFLLLGLGAHLPDRATANIRFILCQVLAMLLEPAWFWLLIIVDKSYQLGIKLDCFIEQAVTNLTQTSFRM